MSIFRHARLRVASGNGTLVQAHQTKFPKMNSLFHTKFSKKSKKSLFYKKLAQTLTFLILQWHKILFLEK